MYEEYYEEELNTQKQGSMSYEQLMGVIDSRVAASRLSDEERKEMAYLRGEVERLGRGLSDAIRAGAEAIARKQEELAKKQEELHKAQEDAKMWKKSYEDLAKCL